MADGGNVIFKFLGDDKALKTTLNGLSKATSVALKGITAGIGAVTAGFTGIVVASVKARGEMEQTLGGIETIFKDGADTIIENSKKAYKEAGISAQDYMDQAVSFGASLRRTLGDNDEEVAKYVDMAIKDMADNSAKMGTNIESIQNAYAGLAKGNATMLDNLKLGYGGTQKEMLQLAKDMGVISKNVKSFNDMSFDQAILAIHKLQEQLEITGTASKEAETTMTGSINAMKASWQNFLSGQGDLSSVLESADIALTNVLRIVDEALPDIMSQIEENLPQILELGGRILTTLVNGIVQYMPQILDIVIQIIELICNALLENSDKLGDIAFMLMEVMGKAIISAIPRVLLAIAELMGALLLAITEFNGDIWVKGADLFGEFIEGLKSKIEKIGQFWEDVKTAIKTSIDILKGDATEWGADFMWGFINGIVSKITDLKNAVSEVANTVASYLHFSKPDVGPLREYETWFPDMIDGLSKSLAKASPELVNQMEDLTMAMSPTLNGGANSYNSNVYINLQPTFEQDPLGQMVSSIKTFSNGTKNDYNYGYGG